MSIIAEIFTPMYGKPCWQCRQGHGSFLTLEFGEPHVHIKEPRPVSEHASERIRKNASRRSVRVQGDWHLWIYLCDWRIFSDTQLLAADNSKRRVIRRATSELEGQLLTRVSVDNTSCVSLFEFDSGGKIEAIPNTTVYESTDALWLLYEPSGDVLTLRADGQYCHLPGKLPLTEHNWQPLRTA